MSRSSSIAQRIGHEQGRTVRASLIAILVLVAGAALFIGIPQKKATVPTPQASRQAGSLLAAGVWSNKGSESFIECESSESEAIALEILAQNSQGEPVAVKDFDLEPYGIRSLRLNQIADESLKGKTGTYLLQALGKPAEPVKVTCWTMQASKNPQAGDPAKGRTFIPAQSLPLKGVSYVVSNNAPLAGAASGAINKLTVYNPGNKPFSFVVQAAGKKSVNAQKKHALREIRPGSRIDIKLKSKAGNAMALFEVHPQDDRQVYGAYLGRYNPERAGSKTPAVVFAARSATCDPGYVKVSQSIWQESIVEMASLADSELPVSLDFYMIDGVPQTAGMATLTPLSPQAVSVSTYLGDNDEGLVHATCSEQPGIQSAAKKKASIIVQTANAGYLGKDGAPPDIIPRAA